MVAARKPVEEIDEDFEEVMSAGKPKPKAAASAKGKKVIKHVKPKIAHKPRAIVPVVEEDEDEVEELAPIPAGARIISDAEARETHDVVIYRPGRQDSGWTKMNGVEFHAGKEVKIPRSKTVSATIRQQMQLQDGSIVSRGVETRIPMIELLTGNPLFCVNGVEPVPRKKMRARVPTDSNSYKPYAIEWIGRAESAVELDARWRGEQELRERIGVDEHDLQYILPFYEIRHEMLKGDPIGDND